MVENGSFKVVQFVKLHGELIDALVDLFTDLNFQMGSIDVNEIFQMRVTAYNSNAHYELCFGTDKYIYIAKMHCNDYHWDKTEKVLIDDYYLSLDEVLNIIKNTVK